MFAIALTSSSDSLSQSFTVRNQLYLYFPILCLARLSWVHQSLIFAFAGTSYSSTSTAKHSLPNPVLEKVSLICHWSWFLGIASWIAFRHDGGILMAIIWVLVSECACGVMLGSVFSLNHVSFLEDIILSIKPLII